MNSKLKKIFLISLAALIAFSSAACKKSVKVDNVSSEPVISSKPAVSEEAPVDNGIRLVISSPQKNTDYVTEPDYTFFGTSDPAEPLTVNGTAVERGEDGIFAYSVKLNVGNNVFNFEHKGETHTYTVNYRYVIIKEYTPSGAQTYPSGSTIVVNVNARRGSTVTVAFNGETITLTPEKDTGENKTDFIGYNGVIRLPSDNAQDLNLGKITYKAVHNGKTESFSSGKIICKKSDVIVDYDPNATPNGGRYMNVGSGYIAEIVEYNAETFDGNVSDASLKDGSVDWSRPTNNYLPKGTLDYCSTSLISYKETNYVTLRAGYRVYLERKDKPHTELKPVVRRYVGSLPDHNEIKVADFSEDGSHTRLTLDALWKAPFYLDILPQSYTNPAKQDYRITQATYNYIDITFCYATSFEGEITVPESNPLFKSAEVIQNYTADGSATRDFTLRLHLKKQGAFYGWDSYYNENNQLVFEFLNPKAVTADASNEYGVNLNGARNTILAVLPGMLHEKSGCIVNISSMWGQHGASCEVPYSCTKHALIGLTRSLALEVAPSGIRVNCVAPGVIETDMVRVLGEETIRDLVEQTPLGCLGRPEDIAEAVVYLASDKASFVTGQVLAVDGAFVL